MLTIGTQRTNYQPAETYEQYLAGKMELWRHSFGYYGVVFYYFIYGENKPRWNGKTGSKAWPMEKQKSNSYGLLLPYHNTKKIDC